MTQVIACSTREGIVLATDSRATRFDPAGGRNHFSLKKIFRLNSHAALISAGAGVGIEMSMAFQQLLQAHPSDDIDQIASMALPFFTERYQRWLDEGVPSTGFSGEGEEVSEADLPLSGLYFVLGGYAFKDRVSPFSLQLLGTEGKGVLFRNIPASRIISIPRSLSMEKRLLTCTEREAPLDEILSVCKSFLIRRSAEEEVGPPFHFATITSSGYRSVGEDEVKG